MGLRSFMSSAQPRSVTITAAAAELRSGALPAVIVPFLRKAGRSLPRLARVVSGAASRPGERPGLFSFELDRVISSANLPALAPLKRFWERSAHRSCSSRVSCRALRNQVLGVPAGVFARESVVQAVAQHAVVNLGRAHPVSPAAAVHEVRRPIHVLHAPGDGYVNFAGDNLLRGCNDGLAHPNRRHG